MGQMRVRRTGPWVKISCPFSWVQFIPRVGQRVSLEETPKIKCPKKVADYERKSPESSDSGDFWRRLLDSNQWPHACEDSIGMPSAEFWENKAGLPHDFLTRGYALLHCFRPIFSVRGSRRGSTGALRREKRIGPRWRTSTATKRRSTLHWCRPYRKTSH